MEEFDLLTHIREKDDESVVVWLFNIGVERYWSQDISTIKSGNDECIVNHMEEMNLLITRKQDILILRKRPDADYLAMFAKKGYEIPTIITPSFENESLGISEIVLEDDELLEKLNLISKEHQRVFFVPYGVSRLEEKIAEKCGFELIGGSNALSKLINNKIFARNISEELGFPVAEGKICYSLGAVRENSEILLKRFKKIVIKYPTGASGKGLWVIDSEKQLATIMRIIQRICTRKGIVEEFIVEGWYEKKCDLNYQIYVGKNGRIETFSIKEQLLNETVYIGSLVPPRLSEKVLEQCKRYGEKIGKLLYAQGYNGLLGVDAMITEEDILIPVIEINARFTLSTYTSFLLKSDKSEKLLSFYHRIPLGEKDSYRTVTKQLSEEIEDVQGFCYVSETINSETVGQYGRLFMMVFGKNIEQVLDLYKKILEKW